MSIKATNPSTLFGGTWVSWGSGQVPVGFDSSDTDFSTSEKAGGKKTHVHSTPAHTLTSSEIPAHNHKLAINGTTLDGAYTYAGINGDKFWRASIGLKAQVSTSYSLQMTNSGGGGSHSHGNTGSSSTLQPYIVCYMWKRTA